ncbi:Site-specific recombinase XerD [Marinospirillum celere]|uniref:Site-specific recombinase XerD n=1 Tax=Marinospirillum celere TaxID=1122252 RepID=A0A1I1JBZ4_9GAMM|nr:tyrosine-type recombinase/integrase [Marinospirillum celere]SFB91889.1 Site-specific recombinase XerD [Marinospirillum celere]SFC45905.1 Site-specific recombinase XerD [Marinospirillum celere]SFC51972.1 Site-specific recombinase XerD [Marinospirillum celere]
MTPLRQAMIDQMDLRGLAPKTQQAYLQQIKELARYYHRSPDLLTDEELQAYLLYLIRDRQLSHSSCRQAVHALVFLYSRVLQRRLPRMALAHPKRDQKIPDLLYPDEVLALLQHFVRPKPRAAAFLAYATGMRISEVSALQVQDLDGVHNRIKVRQGKGQKDRYVLFTESLKQNLRDYWRAFRPESYIIYGQYKNRPLDSKYLRLDMKAAAQAAGISKRVCFHSLRHAFATHQLLNGMPLPRLQALLGHKHLQTTFRYLQWVALMDVARNPTEDLLCGLGRAA